jgi:hypothetical protein
MALGLPPARLALLGLVLAGAAAALRAPLPLEPRAVLAGLVLGFGSILAWARLLELSAPGWCARLAAYWLRSLARRTERSPWVDAG